MILDDIIEKKKQQLKKQKSQMTLEGLKQRVRRTGVKSKNSFFRAIKSIEEIAIIGEIKKASPSRGVIRENFNVVELAMEYSKAGVQAISVLTEKDFFKGADEYLMRVRQNVSVPVLRKDFIIDIWQVYQSAYLGADAILLIASVLTDEQIKKFQVVSDILGMDCLVETHTKEEVERVVSLGSKIIGINNRDLTTFKTNIETTKKLVSLIPTDRAVVSESGIHTSDDMKYVKECGADAVLIGEAFMNSPSLERKLKELGI